MMVAQSLGFWLTSHAKFVWNQAAVGHTPGSPQSRGEHGAHGCLARIGGIDGVERLGPSKCRTGHECHDFVISDSRCNNLKGRAKCNVGACVREREDEWTGLMRSAISGDSAAYHRLLKAITPVLRAAASCAQDNRSINPRTSCRTFCSRCI